MTEYDLKKINEFIRRYEKFPKDADFKYKYFQDNFTEEDKKQTLEILDEIDNFFRDLSAFIKVKFGRNSGYLKRSHDIDFETKFLGVPMLNNDKNAIYRAWRTGIRDLENLLLDIRAEIKEILENQPDKLAKYEDREEIRLKRLGKSIFVLITFIFPIICGIYIIQVAFDWDNLIWNKPLTWVNTTNYQSLEMLIFVFEFILIGLCTWFYQKYKEAYIKWFYDRYKI